MYTSMQGCETPKCHLAMCTYSIHCGDYCDVMAQHHDQSCQSFIVRRTVKSPPFASATIYCCVYGLAVGLNTNASIES